MNETVLSQAPQIIPVITDDRDFYVGIGLAGITFIALVIALFQEPIKKLFSRAKLKIAINKFPPDCHQIMLTNQRTGDPLGYTLYSRIRISNESKINTSENTEVFISHFWKVNDDDNKEEIKTFLPMNLKWSHTHEIKTDILPDFYRYSDFGSFRKIDEDGVVLLLDTIVQPNPVAEGKVPNIIDPGRYIFEIVVSGRNVSPQKKRWRLEFEDKWNDDEKEMLDSITIEEVKSND